MTRNGMITVGLIGFLWLSAQASSQSAEELFHKGILLEEVKGELERAIETYELVLKTSSVDRALAAKTQLHIALCYERLGQEKAAVYFRRVIEGYPDQTEAVQVAREKLRALNGDRAAAVESGKPSVRLVLSGSWEAAGVFSPDESKIAYTDWALASGNLMIKDLKTGKTKSLTDAGTGAGLYEFGQDPVWSPDGKSIAYAWFSKDPYWTVRIASSQGGDPRVLYANSEITAFPSDWSGDGKYILCTIIKGDRSSAIATISVSSGELRQLISLEWNRNSRHARFSPDGKSIVYDVTKEGNRDIYCVSADGSRHHRLTDSPGEDGNPVWSHDGRYILFSSNRRGNWDLWAVEMSKGGPNGSPFLIKSDFGNYGKAVTRSGKLAYTVSNSMEDAFYVKVDPSTGESSGPPTLLTKSYYGQNSRPAWSPDGTKLAYVSFRGGSFPLLCIVPESGGAEECIDTGMRYFNRFFWSPDGQTVALSPQGKNGQNGVHLFSLTTRELRPLLLVPNFRGVGWSRDGREFLLVKKKASAQDAEDEMIAVDVATGSERIVKTASDSPNFPWGGQPQSSPDQNNVAFVERRAPDIQRLVISDPEFKEKHVLAEVKEPGSITFPRWSPDGTKLAYNLTREDAVTVIRISAADRTWQKTVDTGKMRLKNGHFSPAWSPDGTKLAFTLGEEKHELWVMENFLPKEAARAAALRK